MKIGRITKFLDENKWIVLIFIFHIFLVNNFLSISEVINNYPITNDDYPYVYYKTLLMKYSLSGNRFVTYNPFFFGGYEYGGGMLSREYLAEHKIPTLLYFLLPNIPTVEIFKTFIFALALIFPLVMYYVAINFDLSKRKSLLVAFLGVLTWQFNYFIHERFFTGGELTFVAMSLLGVIGVSMLYKYLTRNKKKHLYLTAFFFALAITTHIYSIIVFPIPVMLLLYFYRKKWLLFSLIGAAVLLSIIAFSPLYGRLSYVLSYVEPIRIFQSAGLESIVSDVKNKTVQTITIILGFYGVWLFRKGKKNIFFNFFLITATFYLLYSYFGSYSNLIALTAPERLLIPLTLFLLVPAAEGIQSIYESIIKVDKKYLLIFIIPILVLSIFKTPEIFYGIGSQMASSFNQKISTNMPEDTKKIISWIKMNTTQDARIMIEDSGYKAEHKLGGHMLALFPEYTKREFIGGPIPYFYVKRGYVIPTFYEGVLFNAKNVSDYSLDELKNYFNLFNIKWIIAWSDESKKTFEKYPEFIHRIQSIGEFEIYETEIKPNFFLKGSGKITADLNNISISNATEEETIIKYGFTESLKITPHLRFDAYKVENAASFIRIFNGNVTDFELGN